MKKISSRFSVAIHILSVIALIPYDCTGNLIAESVNTNSVIIRKVISQLKKAGIVKVRAGIGGASLQKELNQITLLDVYKAVEVVDNEDLFNFHDNPNIKCPVGKYIEPVLRPKMREAQAALEEKLAQMSLQEFITELKEKIDYS